MERFGNLKENIDDEYNYLEALCNAIKHKKKRRQIKAFIDEKEEKLASLRQSFREGTFQTSPYTFMEVYEPKHRLIGMLPFPDHVQQWAVLNQCEDDVTRSFNAYTYGGVKGRGPQAYLNAIRKDIREHPKETTYFLLCDVHHFYPEIDHDSCKRMIREKIKDEDVLSFFDEYIDSNGKNIGMYPGTKIAQFISLVYTYQFGHDLKRCFYIDECPKLVEYYTQRYIAERINTASTKQDEYELSQGVQYLSDKFKRNLNILRYTYRLADDTLVLHSDKTFLHLLVEWIGLYYARELKLTLNPKWKIAPIAKGADTGGYVHYSEHVRGRKRNKVALCREVAALRKKGLTPDEIFIAASSRIGFLKHANTTQLMIKLLGMETQRRRLGQVIRNKKSPWPDLPATQKMKFDDILYDTRLPEDQRGAEEDKLIELVDYKIEDSIVEKDAQGNPKKCLVIRFKLRGEEHYAFTGSAVLIDQAEKDFSHADLPVDTVVKVMTNKFGKKFFRFT